MDLTRSKAYFSGKQKWPALALKVSAKSLQDKLIAANIRVELLDFYMMPLVQGLRNVEKPKEIINILEDYSFSEVKCKLFKYPIGEKFNLEYAATDLLFLSQLDRLNNKFEKEIKIKTIPSFPVQLLTTEILLPTEHIFSVMSLYYIWPDSEALEINYTNKIK